MMEYWNDGVAPFGQINACGEIREGNWFCRRPALTNHSMNAIIPLFHYSIIPVMVWKNASVEIPYYQQFVEIPRH